MTDQQTPIPSDRAVKTTGGPGGIRADLVAVYDGALAAIPDAEGEGAERILEALARAESPQELDAPWRSGDLVAYQDQELVILAARKQPSDFVGGLPWFLVIDAAAVETGEKVVIVTGAVDVVAQVAMLVSKDWLPYIVIPRVADRPTRNGYYPQHLEMVGPLKPNGR